MTKKVKYDFEKDAIFVKWNFEIEFDVLDKTPWGKSLGRIERIVEPIWIRWSFKKIYVHASQTRDERVDGKRRVIECDTPAFKGGIWDDDNFFSNAWYIWVCKEHKEMFYMAYPADHHKKIVFIDMFTTFYSKIYFISNENKDE